ncbi:MAG: hypothetical protein KBG47_04100 [Bacteroidia bacterium]|nr:hypothetical protein [Sphingobacteriaceae bacterium]MBP9068664.1 hypothetical protein [Bacteroidia bacterium]
MINHFLLIAGLSLVALIVSNEEITDKLNYFPVLVFFTINIMILNKDRISLYLFSNIIILYSLYQIFNTYRKDQVLSQIFNACFFLSAALYLNIANIFLFPFVFIALAILRPFNWREFVMVIMGFVCPIFIYECLSYLFSFNQWYIFENLAELFSYFKMPILNMDFLPFLIATTLLFVFSIINIMADGLGNTVKKQKAKSCFFWYLILIVPLFFISGSGYVNIMLLYSIPLSFLIGDLLFSLRSGKLINILLLVFILSSLYYVVKKTALL